MMLKIASASAIYGANGSNGVIIVTTKRGKSGKPVVNLNTYVGLSLAPERYDVMNADQYAAFYSALYGPKPEYEQAFREKYYGPWGTARYRKQNGEISIEVLSGTLKIKSLSLPLNQISGKAPEVYINNKKVKTRRSLQDEKWVFDINYLTYLNNNSTLLIK